MLLLRLLDPLGTLFKWCPLELAGLHEVEAARAAHARRYVIRGRHAQVLWNRFALDGHRSWRARRLAGLELSLFLFLRFRRLLRASEVVVEDLAEAGIYAGSADYAHEEEDFRRTLDAFNVPSAAEEAGHDCISLLPRLAEEVLRGDEDGISLSVGKAGCCDAWLGGDDMAETNEGDDARRSGDARGLVYHEHKRNEPCNMKTHLSIGNGFGDALLDDFLLLDAGMGLIRCAFDLNSLARAV